MLHMCLFTPTYRYGRDAALAFINAFLYLVVTSSFTKTRTDDGEVSL